MMSWLNDDATERWSIVQWESPVYISNHGRIGVAHFEGVAAQTTETMTIIVWMLKWHEIGSNNLPGHAPIGVDFRELLARAMIVTGRWPAMLILQADSTGHNVVAFVNKINMYLESPIKLEIVHRQQPQREDEHHPIHDILANVVSSHRENVITIEQLANTLSALIDHPNSNQLTTQLYLEHSTQQEKGLSVPMFAYLLPFTNGDHRRARPYPAYVLYRNHPYVPAHPSIDVYRRWTNALIRGQHIELYIVPKSPMGARVFGRLDGLIWDGLIPDTSHVSAVDHRQLVNSLLAEQHRQVQGHIKDFEALMVEQFGGMPRLDAVSGAWVLPASKQGELPEGSSENGNGDSM